MASTEYEYGSINSFGGDASTSFDQPPQTKKQLDVAAASTIKQEQLAQVSFEKAMVLDADTLNLGNGSIRIDNPNQGHSLDAYEVQKDFSYIEDPVKREQAIFNANTRADSQRGALANYLGLDPENVSRQDVYDQGAKATAATQAMFTPNNEGGIFASAELRENTQGEYNRNIGDVLDPTTGQRVSNITNTPEFNADYNSKYNRSKQAIDAEAHRIEREQATENAWVGDNDLSTPQGALANLAAYGASGVARTAGTIANMGPDAIKALSAQSITDTDRETYKTLSAKESKINTLNDQINDPKTSDEDVLKLTAQKYSLGLTPEEEALKTAEKLDKKGLMGAVPTRSKYDILSKEESVTEAMESTERKGYEDADTISEYADTFATNLLGAPTRMADAAAKWVNRKDEEIVGKKNEQAFNNAAKHWNREDADIIDKVSSVGKALGSLGGAFIDTVKDDPAVVAGTFIESLPQMMLAQQTSAGTLAYGIELADDAAKEFKAEYGRDPNAKEKGILLGASFTSAYMDKASGKQVLGPSAAKSIVKNPNKIIAAGKKIADNTPEAIKATLSEGSTEMIQGTLEQYAGKQDIDKVNLGQAFNEGILGAGGGGGMRVAGDVARAAVSKPVQKIVEKASEVASTATDTVTKNVGAVIDATKGKAPNPADISDPIEKADAILHPDNLPANDAPQAEKVAVVDELYAQLDAIEEEALTLTDPDAVEAKVEQSVALNEKIMAYEDSIAPEPKDTQSNVDNIVANTSESQEAKEAVVRLLGSPTSNITDTQLNQLKESNNLNTEEKVLVDNRIKTNQAKKSIEQVNSDVIQGGEGFKGVLEHQRDIARAITSNNKETSEKALTGLETFATKHTTKAKAIELLARGMRDELPQAELEVLDAAAIEASPGKDKTESYMLKEDGSLYTKRDVSSLARKISDEAYYLNSAYTESKALVDNNFTESIPVVKTEEIPENTSTKTVEPKQAIAEEVKTSVIEDLTPSDEGSQINVENNEQKETQSQKEIIAEKPTKETTGNVTEYSDVKGTPLEDGRLANTNRKTGEISVRADITKQQVVDYLTKADTPTSKQKAVVTQYMKDQYDVDLLSKLDSMSDTQAKEFLIAHEQHHIRQGKKAQIPGQPHINEYFTHEQAMIAIAQKADTADMKFMNDYAIQLEAGANIAALRDVTKDKTIGKKKYSLGKQSLTNKITEDNTNINDFFEETPSKENEKSVSVLRTEENYFNNMSDASIENMALTDNQKAAMKDLNSFVDLFKNSFKNDVFLPLDTGKKWTKAELDDNKAHYLTNEEGAFDENLLDTMAVTAFNWLTTGAGNSLENDYETIISILNTDGDNVKVEEAFKLLKDVGSLRNNMVEDFGNDVLKNSGIQIKKGIPENIKLNFNTAIGTYIIGTLDKLSLIDTTNIPNADLANVKIDPGPKAQYPEASSAFIRVASEMKSNVFGSSSLSVRKDIADTAEKVRKSDNLISNLFATKNLRTGPTLELPTSTATDIRGTTKSVPKKQAKIIEKHAQRPHKIKTKQYAIFSSLTPEQQLLASGYTPNVETEIQEHFRIEKEGYNQSLEKEVRDMNEFYEILKENDDLDKPYYFNHRVDKNGRMRVDSNSINMQSSKVHRHLMGMEAWTNTIDTVAERQQYMVAAAMSMGAKVDKHTLQINIEDFHTIYNSDVVQKAIKAINEIESEELSEEVKAGYQADIMAAISEGGENVFSLDGLVSMASYDATKPFDSDLFLEVDGITNGVIIQLIQMAGATPEGNLKQMLERGGIFQGQQTSYGDWYAQPGNNDSYQTLTLDFEKEAKKVSVNVAPNKIVGASKFLGNIIDYVDPDNPEVTSEGRNLTKGPTMNSSYGQSEKALIEGVSDKILSNVYKQIEKNFDNQVELDLIAKAFNEVTNSNMKLTAGKSAMDFVLDPKLEKAFKDEIRIIYSEPVITALNNQYGGLYKTNHEINEAVNIMFHAFNVRYKDAVAKAEEKKGSKISKQENDIIVESLKDIMPSFAHAYTENINSELAVLKTKKAPTVDDALRSKVKMKGEAGAKTKSGNATTTSITARANEFIYEEPGVSPVVLGTHATDSAVIMRLIEKRDAMSVYDAGGFGSNDAVAGTKDFNKGFADLMDEYSLMESVQKSLERTYNNMVSYDKANGTDMMEAWRIATTNSRFLSPSPEKPPIISEFMDYFKGATEKNSEAKAKTVESIDSWVQYNLEEGAHSTKAPTIVNEANIEESTKAVIDDLVDQTIEDSTAVTEAQVARVKQRFLKNGIQSLKNVSNIDILSSVFNGLDFAVEAKIQEIGESKFDKAYDKARNRLLGSSNQKINPYTFNATVEESLTRETSLGIFNGLAKSGNIRDSQAHTVYLSDTLDNVINQVMTPLTLKIRESGDASYGAYGENTLYLNNAMGTLTDGTSMSSQEVYLHELVHSISQEGLENPENYMLRKKVKSLYDHVKANITWEDFLTKNAQGDVVVSANRTLDIEEQAAKDRYAYLFENTAVETDVQGNTVSPYLHEFVALGTTNERFMQILKDMANPDEKIWRGDTLLEKLTNLLNEVLTVITEGIFNPRGSDAKIELMNLTKKLSGVNNRKSNMLFNESNIFNELDLKTVDAVNDWVLHPLTKYGPRIANKIPGKGIATEVARSGLHLASTMAGNILSPVRMQGFKQGIQEAARRINLSEKGIFAQLYTEMNGITVDNSAYHALLRKSNRMIDQMRTNVAAELGAHLLKSFLTDVSSNEKVAITKALLKPDIDSILRNYSFTEIVNFMRNPGDLKVEIDKLTQGLNKYGKARNYYSKHAESLGKFMATGGHNQVGGMLNVHNIARMVTFKGKSKPSIENINQAELDLDILVSLHALAFTDQKFLKDGANIIEREFAADKDSNGITFVLQNHKFLKEQALDQTFNGQKALMIKGYIKELFNPNVDFIIATEAQEAELIEKGYQKGVVVKPDKNAPNKEIMHMYISKDGNMNTWMKMTTSLTSDVAKGADLIKVNTQQNIATPDVQAFADGNIISKNIESQIAKQFTSTDTRIPEGDNVLVPVINTKGETVAYRYMMKESLKITLMEKNDDFSEVMGAMQGSIHDKVNSKEINKEVMDLIRKDYKDNFKENPEQFVAIGKNVNDAEYRQLYFMMPETMRKQMINDWGQTKMYVRKNLVTTIFGYRKLSLAYDKYDKARLPADSISMKLFEVISKNVTKTFGYGKVKKGENITKEISSMVKDSIVIKSGSVLWGNIVSNNWLLWMNGLSKNEIAVSQAMGADAVVQYQKDITQLRDLQREVELNPKLKHKSQVKAQIARLQDDINKNPVRPLIEEGIFQTIVEDLDPNDISTVKTKIDEWIDPVVSKLPEGVKKVGEQVMMTHDTGLYKFMRNTTQYSDFVARFAMHKHNLAKGMSIEASLEMIVETFVNYDLPTSALMQYGNDMNLLMFTKFFLRIQKVIAKSVAKAPARLLTMYGIEGMFGNVPDITDSNILTNSVLNKTTTPINAALDRVGPQILNGYY